MQPNRKQSLVGVFTFLMLYSLYFRCVSLMVCVCVINIISRVLSLSRIYCKDPFSYLLLLYTAMVEPNRIFGEKCTKTDIVVNQGPTAPLPSGIPTYTVEILNVCATSCNIAAIHLRCGWFSSAKLINPKVFRRLGFDDCLVNDGKSLGVGESLSFQYANTFSYPMSVSSVACV